MPRILFTKRLPNAIKPVQATPHAAGFDLFAADIEYRPGKGMLVVDTGLNIAFDTGHVLYLFGRSGHAMKHGIRLANCVGVIDADYRGPLKLLLSTNDPDDRHILLNEVKVGDRVGQAVLMQLPAVEWVDSDELPSSERGEGGFGSTGS